LATGGSINADGDAFRITGFNLKDVDWCKYDRRAEEKWWHLYPFGERYHDRDMVGRPWNDQQIDLDFFMPYYGFRFNYSFIFPEGFVAFSYPQYIQPPYTFPNPNWPDSYDSSLIAAFMSPQTTMAIGETIISHVWYRVVARPPNMIGRIGDRLPEDMQRPDAFGQTQFGNIFGRGNRGTQCGGQSPKYYQGQQMRVMDGRVEDPAFLDQLSRDIQSGMVGARGFTADYALIVTWERMAYGGAPKAIQLNMYDQVKRWQNTYQMVMASDEIRSYTMFNFANINWTSSTSAGALFGRGGKQSALVGFNGGNGTGFFELPYSAEGNSYKLVQFGSTQTAGRWLARTDERPIYGGCINTSIGVLRVHTGEIPMLGGFALNVSGPCFRPDNVIMMQIEEVTIDCRRIDMVIARCVIPVNSIFRVGLVMAKLSVDGGKNFPWWRKVTIMQPALSRRPVKLINDPIKIKNNWRSPEAENLTLQWPHVNISTNPNAQVDITLWGYWEDVEGHSLKEVGALAVKTPNKGIYSFNPRTLGREHMHPDAWRLYRGGLVQVRVSDDWMADMGDALYWSGLIPFGWYFRGMWEYEYGSNWAEDLCHEWYDWDGRRTNFIRELEQTLSCPCTMDQALSDFGRFTSLPDCDQFGNTECPNTRGAKHCVMSTQTVWTGAGQMCCYDYEGWLMFSDDYEWNAEYLRFYSAGVPYRAHPWGSYPFKRPPYVPSLSNFYNDLMPYDICCKWAGKCEFFFWRRQTSGCMEYRHSVNGFAFGQGHFVTFDGLRYPFQGKGYYVLSQMKGPRHDFMAQIRLEQPPKTLWNSEVPATIITGIAARDNGSATVQVFARKEFRRERYKLDVYVDGVRAFFDRPYKKIQTFTGGALRNPPRNMNTSEIQVMFSTGVGILVQETRGMLSIQVALPWNYNETYKDPYGRDMFGAPSVGTGKCASHVRTLGLLGTFNNDRMDELITPECGIVSVNYQGEINENEARTIYRDFGEKWRVDGNRHPLLFQERHKPLYNPLTFGSRNYLPAFDPYRRNNQSFWHSLIFTEEQVRSTCQGIRQCMYDYMTSGRKEIAIDTLNSLKKFEGFKQRGEKKLISCGNLLKNKGVIKFPPGNHYLDGVKVTFQCKPEFFLHGAEARTCRNGTWSPGWWAWCRERDVETGLKWFTGIIVSLMILGLIIAIFLYCYCMRVRAFKYRDNRRAPAPYGLRKDIQSKHNAFPMPPKQQMAPPYAGASYDTQSRGTRTPAGTGAHTPITPVTPVPVMEQEPPKVGLHHGGSHGSGSSVNRQVMNFHETGI
jgi:hypothetical protein